MWALLSAWLPGLSSCDSRRFDPPRRLGPPALVAHDDGPRFWLLAKQEERKERRLGGARSTSGSWVTEILYNIELQCHDPRTAQRVWKKRLLTLKEKEGGHNAAARILGQEGKIVWLFLNDRVVGLSSADGSVVTDGPALEKKNAPLQGLLPKELKFYTFDGGLVITAADARRYRVRGLDQVAQPYKPPSDDAFRIMQMMASQWNGGYQTADFLVRQATLGGRWLGFFSEKEAADAGDDDFGDTLKNPDSVSPEGSRALRAFWTARIGKTKEFSEGSHDRLFDITRVPGGRDYLEAGLLIRQGTNRALPMRDPEGLLVLHRTRLDADGRLALTRLDEKLQERWTTTLPFLDLTNRFEFPDRLLLHGAIQLTEQGITRWEERLVTVELANGRMQGWNLTLEQSIPSTELEKRN